MKHSFLAVLFVSSIVGVVGCSKEEPDGTAEKMGKKIDEAAESMQKQVAETAEAAGERAAEAKAELGTAMEAKGKEMREKAEESSR